jgi:hypothetical protein
VLYPLQKYENEQNIFLGPAAAITNAHDFFVIRQIMFQ